MVPIKEGFCTASYLNLTVKLSFHSSIYLRLGRGKARWADGRTPSPENYTIFFMYITSSCIYFFYFLNSLGKNHAIRLSGYKIYWAKTIQKYSNMVWYCFGQARTIFSKRHLTIKSIQFLISSFFFFIFFMWDFIHTLTELLLGCLSWKTNNDAWIVICGQNYFSYLTSWKAKKSDMCIEYTRCNLCLQITNRLIPSFNILNTIWFHMWS